MFRLKKIFAAMSVGLMALAPAACNEFDQQRPLTYEKGVYGGAEDQKLDDAQRRALRQRGMRQKF